LFGRLQKYDFVIIVYHIMVLVLRNYLWWNFDN